MDETTIEVEECDWMIPPSAWLVTRRVGKGDWFLTSRTLAAAGDGPQASWMCGTDRDTFRYPSPEDARAALDELTANGIRLPAGVIRIIPVLEAPNAA